MTRSRIVLNCLVTAVVVALVGLAGCSTPEKPKELTELERILQEEGAQEVRDKPGARKYYEEARKLREAALDVLEDERDAERARHYAIRGKLRYRTAEQVARQLELKEGVEKADAKVQKMSPEAQKLAKKRNELQTEVQKLHKKVQEAEASRAAQRRRDIQDESAAADKEEELEAQNKMERALAAKKNALELNANQHAKGAYNRAENELKSARSMLEGESYSDAVETSESAKRLFEKAADEARPKYEEQKAKQQPMKRLAKLKEKLTYNFGDAQVESVGRGVRVVIPELFSRDSTNVVGSKRGDLKTVAELAEKYDEFSISIDGYTREGDPTENLSTSQLRARNVQDFLKGEGIDTDRIETDGKGQSNARFSSPSKNDRVEITFRL